MASLTFISALVTLHFNDLFLGLVPQLHQEQLWGRRDWVWLLSSVRHIVGALLRLV